jgi:hypothetical protein
MELAREAAEREEKEDDILWSFLDAAAARGATPHQLDIIIEEYAKTARQGEQKKGDSWKPK